MGGARRSAEELRRAGCDVEVQSVAGKRHQMVSSKAEMGRMMKFWALRLQSRPNDESFVEVAG